jgi:RNA polymerase sigma factor (sigma-70 family)
MDEAMTRWAEVCGRRCSHGDADLADDCTQAARTRAVTDYAQSPEMTRAVRLTRMAEAACDAMRSWRKSRARTSCVPLTVTIGDAVPGPDDMARADDRMTAQRAMAAMTPAERETILRLADGYTMEEIAQEQGVTRQAVSLRVVKIRARVAHQFGEAA